MNCETAQRLISRHLDDPFPEAKRLEVQSHLAACPDCEHHRADLRYVLASVKQLAPAMAPATLTSKLRVHASYDRERRQGAGEFSSPGQRWLTRAKLTIEDLMRPLALPAAGGLLSSILFFTVLVDTFAVQMPAQDDIPLGVYTQVKVGSLSPFGFTGGDVTVELTINKEGRVVGIRSHDVNLTRDELNQLGNLVLFTSFDPATADGQPTDGKVMVKTSRINVQG